MERRHFDPQLKLTGLLKEGEKSDYIVFTISLALFEIVCIVNIPPEGEHESTVFCKFKVRRSQKLVHQQRPRHDEPEERSIG